ncbi:MAG: alpha/beta fold hydrolase [Acidobacteriia bacterium]|nr:alpha/beta fold hydrolase [Terriglobia bacterium]
MRAPGVDEISGYLAMPDGCSVYVRQYTPEGGGRKRPVVVVPADGEERTWSQRTMVNLARSLARVGHPVVRFDFRGQGESDGPFEATDVGSRLEDLAAVVERTRSWSGVAPSLVGFRLGATVAAHHAAATAGVVGPIVAVEPVDSIPTYIDDMLRKNLANQFAVQKKVIVNRKQLLERVRSGTNVSCNGFHLSRGFLESLERLEQAGVQQRIAALSALWISRPAGQEAGVPRGIPTFWSERPILGPHPSELFRAVEARLDDVQAVKWSGPFPLDDASGGGSRVASIATGSGRLVATWHSLRGDGTAFLFLNPGPNDRSGPHGLYARLAAALAAEGHHVLRLDARSIGESEGDDQGNQGRPVVDYYREINEGAMVSSAAAALNWLAGRGHRETVLFGLCGGAVNAALAACETTSQVRHVVLLGTPVLHLGVGEGVALSDEAVRDEVKILRHKLVDPGSLIRFLTFRSDYRAVGRVIAALAGRMTGSRGRTGSGGDERPLHPQTIMPLVRAIAGFRSAGGRPVFVFSEHDRLLGLFRTHFPSSARGAGGPENLDLRVLAGANHNVTDRPSEARLLEILRSAPHPSAAERLS